MLYRFHGTSGASCLVDAESEWMTKLLNVCLIMGAMELFVIVDQYKMKKEKETLAAAEAASSASTTTSSGGVTLKGYARINVLQVINKLLQSKTSPGSMMLTEAHDQEELLHYFSSQVLSLFLP